MKELNSKPSAKIALKRNVLKMYEVDKVDTIYLKDKAEFEIELFNPLQVSVLAKIELNGKLINGGGLIINPGQRIFLERYLDDNKKFKFSTYKVENNNLDVDYAISLNGIVKVSFYLETEYQPICNPLWTSTTIYNPIYSTPTILLGSLGVYTTPSYGTLTGGTSYVNNTTLTSNNKVSCFASSTNSINSTSSVNNINKLTSSNFDVSKKLLNTEKIEKVEKETGKIEKGNLSNQAFVSSSKQFNSYTNNVVLIKILPESEKVYTVDDLKHRKYCTNCGTKIKENDKYCANCGTKI